MHTPLAPGPFLADVGPEIFIGPAAGSTAIAGVFLAAAIVAAGFWQRRRLAGRPTGVPRRAYFLSMAAVAFFATAIPLLIGMFFPPFLLVALAFVVISLCYLVRAFWLRTEPPLVVSPTALELSEPVRQGGPP